MSVLLAANEQQRVGHKCAPAKGDSDSVRSGFERSLARTGALMLFFHLNYTLSHSYYSDAPAPGSGSAL